MAQYFTPTFKQRMRVLAAMVTMLAAAAPFVLGLLAMQALGPHPTGLAPAAVALVAFALGGLAPWLMQNVMGLAGNAGLRRRLATHQDPAALSEAEFVGFSPGQDLRIWHGETDRDIGFLRIEGGTLIYRGDDYEWALPAELVDHLDLAAAEGSLPRIVIHWHVPREVSRTLSLESREAASLTGVRRATGELFGRLKDWYRRQPGAEGAGAEGAFAEGAPAGEGMALATAKPPFGLPPTDVSGGQIVDQPASGSCVTILSVGVIMLVLIWRISGACFASGQYYEGILWAGLISVLGALGIGYLLHYLQAWEAEHGRQAQRER